MFDDFDLSDAAKAAGLAALIGGGYQAARRVPVYGLETVASLLSKEGRDIRRVGRALGPLGERGFSIPQQNEALLENMMIVRPDIMDSTGYAKDTIRTGKLKMAPDWELMDADDKVISPKDFLPMDRAVYRPDGLVIQAGSVQDLIDAGVLYRPKFKKERDQAALNAAFNRLGRAMKGDNVNLKAGNVETALDFNNPYVVQEVLDNLATATKKNREVTARVEAVRARNTAGSQRSYIKQARESSKVREQLTKQLKDIAKSFSATTGIPEDQALTGVARAFAAVSPQTDLAGNWRRFNEALAAIAPDDFGGMSAARFDEWVRSPAGRKLFDNAHNTMMNKAINALMGGRGTGASELLFAGANDLTKTDLLADVLSGKVDSAILDSAELDRILAILPEDQAAAARRGLFGNPNLYGLAVRAVNEALQEGQLGRTAWAIRPKRTGLAGQQAALQLRRGSQAG